jgi:hypothetical protein
VKIYVASSWRNEARQQEVVHALRAKGHDVYDFRHPAPGNEGFGWRFCAPDPAALKDPKRFRDEVLPHPSCKKGFDFDMNALSDADATVLVLPCGRSAHLELGYAVGSNQLTIVLLDNPMSEPELMYLMCDHICVSIEEVVCMVEEDQARCIVEEDQARMNERLRALRVPFTKLTDRQRAEESAKGYVAGGRREPGGMLDPNSKDD